MEQIMTASTTTLLSTKHVLSSPTIGGEYLIIAAIITVLILGVLIYLFVKRGKKKEDPIGHVHKLELPPYLSNVGLRLISKGYINVSDDAGVFVKFYERLIETYGRKGLYRVPWYITAGTTPQDVDALIKSLGEGPLIDEGGDAPFRFLAFRNFTLICCQLDNAFDITAPSIDQAWQKLFTLLMRYRPAMPLNGAIVQLNMQNFYGEKQLTSSEIAEGAAKVGQFFSRMQANLSIQLPVYVLCNHAEALTGFMDVCQEIPEGKDQNIIGWSNPENVTNVLAPDTISQAFSSICNNLRELNNRLFSRSDDTDGAMGSMMLPYVFKNLQDKIEPYLNAIFSDNRLQKSPIFRGLYIAGYGNFREVKSNKSVVKLEVYEGAKDRHLLFVRDLFTKKIVLEGCLVRPQEVGVSRLNKAVRFTKVICIIAAFLAVGSMWYGISHTLSKRAVVRPSLEKLSGILADMNRVQLHSSRYNQEFYKSYAQDVLTLIRKVQGNQFLTWAFPPSWFGRVNVKIEKQLQYAYQSAMIKTIYVDLIIKLQTILGVTLDTNQPIKLGDLLAPEKGKNFKKLQQYVGDFKVLLGFIDQFNHLAQSVDVKDLQDLTRFVFKSELPEAFANDFLEIYAIVKKMHYPKIDIYAYQDKAHKNILKLFSDFASPLFDSRNLNGLPAQINSVYNTLATGDTSKKAINNLLAWYAQFNDPSQKEVNKIEWLKKKNGLLDKEMNDLLKHIDEMPIFGPHVTNALEKQLATGLKSFKSTIDRMKKMYKPFFEKEEDKSSAAVVTALHKILKDFFKPSYMQPVSDTSIQPPSDNSVVFWDSKRMQVAMGLFNSYQQHHTHNERAFPVEYQESMDDIAQHMLRRTLLYALSKAQYNVSLARLVSSSQQTKVDLAIAKGFGESVSTLIDILEVLAQDKKNLALYTQLHNQILQATTWLLDHSDQAFNRQSPYTVDNQAVINWNGNPGLSLQMFQVSDGASLQKYLAKQMQFISNLADNFIKPVITVSESHYFIGEDLFDSDQFSKWKDIYKQVQAKKAQKPDSTIDQLNQFITGKLNRLSADKMFELWEKGKQLSPSSDFFMNRMMQLKAKAMAYSEVFVRERSIENYQLLSKKFNKDLAGKFPFASTGSDALSIDKLHEFFEMFDQMGGDSTAILEGVKSLPQAKSITAFIY